MTKIAIRIAAITALIGTPAWAADMAARAPLPAVAPAPVFTWTGFYAGVNLGYGWGKDDWSNLVAPVGNVGGTFVQYDTHGMLGGFQWGYNRQIGQWVLGFASDFDWTGMKGSNICFGSAGGFHATCGGRVEWITTSTVRLGLALGPALPYVKGGWALDYDKFSATNIGVTVPTQANYLDTRSYRSGWTFGGGLEYAFDPHWSAFVEYDYLSFGNAQEGFTPSVPNNITTNFSANINQKISIVKGGLNFKYGDWLDSFLGTSH